MKKQKIKGYKVTDKDMKCRGFQYELNKLYTIKEKISICNVGFHYCEKINDCWNYYSFDSSNRVFEIEDTGDTITERKKNCTNKIKLIKELTWEEVLEICNEGKDNIGHSNTGDRNTGDSNTGYSNTGDRNTGNWNTGYSNTGDSNTGDRNTGYSNTGDSNTGYRNTGNWNTGYWNTGYRNTGDRNTGDRNTGNWNTGDRNTGNWNKTNFETGFFNTMQSDYINVFNKSCKRELWNNCEKPDFIYFEVTKWDDVSKKTVPIDYKKAFQDSFKNASKEDVKLLKALPNFDKDVFFEISGIMIGDDE